MKFLSKSINPVTFEQVYGGSELVHVEDLSELMSKKSIWQEAEIRFANKNHTAGILMRRSEYDRPQIEKEVVDVFLERLKIVLKGKGLASEKIERTAAKLIDTEEESIVLYLDLRYTSDYLSFKSLTKFCEPVLTQAASVDEDFQRFYGLVKSDHLSYYSVSEDYGYENQYCGGVTDPGRKGHFVVRTPFIDIENTDIYDYDLDHCIISKMAKFFRSMLYQKPGVYPHEFLFTKKDSIIDPNKFVNKFFNIIYKYVKRDHEKKQIDNSEFVEGQIDHTCIHIPNMYFKASLDVVV